LYTLTTHELIELSKEESNQALKQDFNRMLQKIRPLTCKPNSSLHDKIFLFQTSQLKEDSSERKKTVQTTSDLIPENDPKAICMTYGNMFQRDLSETDSVQISCWYMKRFTGDELQKAIQERTSYARKADSLNLELHQLELKKYYQNWRVQDAATKPLTQQRTNLIKLRDSIDFLLYPSLREALKPWYEHFRAEVLTSPISFEFSTDRSPIQSDKDPFLEKSFHLHHGFVENPLYGNSICPGDSISVKGISLYQTPVIEDYDSPWKDPSLSFYSIGNRYLVVFKDESDIGETFQYFRQSYFIYEVQD
jgi:hypothetical protein